MVVGRRDELALLDRAHSRALAGDGGLVVVRGAPGIGKTALVDAAVRRWSTRSARASCWEVGGAPPLWPWRQVLGRLGAVPDLERPKFAAIEAVVDAILASCAEAPLVVVVDDAHAADPASLDALRRVAVEAVGRRLLVLATRRDVGVARDPALEAVDRLGTVVALGGLDAEAVSALVSARRGRPPEPDELARLVEGTGGNPFLVGEVAVAGPSSHGVRDLVLAHLAHLSAEALELLAALAAIGRPTRWDLLAALVDVDLTARLAETAAERVTTREGDEIRFAHALLRDTLYEATAPARRRELHARLAAALEATGPVATAEVARHYAAAGPEYRDRARATALIAAREAAARHAWEDAWALYRDRVGETDPEIRLEAARAAVRAGRRSEGRALCVAVLDAARASGDSARFGAAAAALGATLEFMDRDPSYVALLEEALARDLPPRVRVDVAARLARQPALDAADAARRREAAAVALAAAGESEPALLTALDASLAASYEPETVDERAAGAARMAEIARRTADRSARLDAMRWRIGARWERGEILETAGEIAEYRQLADAVHEPGPMINARMRAAVLAWHAGEWAAGDALARDALGVARRAGDPQAEVGWHAPAAIVAFQTGDLPRLAAAEPVVAEAYGRLYAPFLRIIGALAALRLGRPAEARAATEALAARPEDLPRDFARLFALSALADVRVALGQPSPGLAAALAPFAGRPAVLGGFATFGAVSRRLGQLAALAGDRAAAAAHLASAARDEARWGARPMLAYTLRALADLGVGDGCADLARELGLLPLLGEDPPPVRRVAWLALEGDDWRVGFDPGTRIRPRRGFALLARLVASPGEEVSAADLVGAVLEDEGAPVLDEAAIAAYRRRVRSLQRALADADEDTPAGRRIQAEIEDLEQEVSRAIGLGGRRRRVGATGERARTSAAVAIRRGIEGIEEVDPALGEHLRRAVRTGHRCVYRPDPLVAVGWRVTM